MLPQPSPTATLKVAEASPHLPEQSEGRSPRASLSSHPDGSKMNEVQRTPPRPTLQVGSVVDVSVFKEGDLVKVSGLSKGKGFAGVVKRWHFSGRPASHGTKHELRTPGSVGASVPERVIKGKKMAGRMGFERVTVRNLKIFKVDPKNNILAVKGAVPGAKGTLLEIRG